MNTELRKLVKNDFEKDLFKNFRYLGKQWKIYENIET